MQAKIESFSEQPSDSSSAPVVGEQAELIASNLFDLSKYMVDALSFQSYKPFILNLVARRVPSELRNLLIELGQDLYKNQQSYCDRFSNGVLKPDRNTPHRPKAGCQITLESIIDDIKSVAKTFTSYKSDLLKLTENGTINEEDIDRHFQIIHKLDQFETNILFSLESTPEYRAAQIQPIDLKSGNFSDMIKSLGEDIDDISPNIVATIPQREDFLGKVTSFLYHEETKKTVVELVAFPKSHEISLTSTDCLVLGDLHANPIKLIYFLLYENIMKGISEEEYDELLEIYYSKKDEQECLVKGDFFSSIDKNHPRNKLKRFNEIIKKLTPVNESAAPAIILLGDVLADRGSNDYYTLKVLEQLKNYKIFPKILLSNHDREFLAIYENDGFCNFEHMSIHAKPYEARLGDPKQEYSLMGLGNYLRLGLITEKEVLSLVEDVYLPLLTGLDLSVDSDRKVLISFTHAPVPITIISELAKQLGLPCDDATLLQSPEKLVETTDAINNKLKELLREKKLLEFSKENTPLYNLMWERVPTGASQWARNTLLPIGWSMIHVHGHDVSYGTEIWKHDKEKLLIHNLDNVLGKELMYRGNYTVFYYGNNPFYIEKRINTPVTEVSMSTKLASSSGTFFHAGSVSSASPNAETSIQDSITPVSARHGV